MAILTTGDRLTRMSWSTSVPPCKDAKLLEYGFSTSCCLSTGGLDQKQRRH
jgi:hypothetical protein